MTVSFAHYLFFNLAHILSKLNFLRTKVEVHTVPGKACCTLTCVASLKCVAAHPPLPKYTHTYASKIKKRDQTKLAMLLIDPLEEDFKIKMNTHIVSQFELM